MFVCLKKDCHKNCWVKKWGSKILSGQKKFGSKQIFGLKFFLGQ